MHPMLMTMFADAHTLAMRDAADVRRRGRLGRGEPRRFTLRLARRKARLAHA
jgi:hypothetical protein